MKDSYQKSDPKITKEYLNDILEASNHIKKILDNSANSFVDEYYLRAIERFYEIIGEAARQLPESFKLKHKEINWRQMIGLRNIIIHRYREVDQKELLLTAHYSLPDLVKNIKKIIQEEFN